MMRIGSGNVVRYLAWIVVVASAYVLFAKIGLSLAFSVQQVTAVWPPTGIAIAALVLGGYRMWPGVLIGAFLANASTNEPVYTAAGIAIGNTLGPLLGAYLLRLFHFDRTFARVRDALVFVAFASILAMTVTATNGTIQLALAGKIDWSQFWPVWALWWTGDSMGVLLVAPFLLTWSDVLRNRTMRGEAGPTEIVVLIAAAFATAAFQFLSKLPVAFPLYPLVVWAALRVGARVTTAAIVAVVGLAVWGTVHDLGPFRTGTLDQRLMELVWFSAVLSIMGLILCALTSERHFALTQMQVAERRFQVLAETVPQIVWTADATGKIDWFNERWYQYTGQAPDDDVEWHWDRVSHPDDLASVEADWPRMIAAGAPFERELRLRRADGVFRWFLARAEPMRQKKEIVRWYGTYTDIDDQRRALERSARIAKTLQSAFLPETLPKHPNLRFDALYLTAGKEALIGGDWYDAFALPDGRIIVSIGDVVGHGINAAVSAGRIRQSIVATGIDVPDPASILTKVNRLVQLHDAAVATALVALVDPETMTMRYASAGHPPPILASPTTAAHALQYGSLPLGVAAGTEYLGHSATLERDAMVLFYTDGVTEYQRDIDAAERALAAAIDKLVAAKPIAHPAEAIRRAVMGSDTPDDDAVLMVMCASAIVSDGFDELDLRKTWSFHSSHAYSAHSARHEVMRFIEQFAGAEQDIFGAELILGEILANTVEHAPGLVNMEIDWSASSPVVTVLDTGPGLERFVALLPEDELTEDGRGLFLVKTLATEVRVESAQGYGTKLTVVLPISRRENAST